ncbi:MAG: pentapeptide repeat-containing protein [Alphaproteobacteria bacterium]|nr:pentapeptide repeat-containing protein [Alphaproteobacteria bacterium]MDA8005560.1 pentapeptide repeat-containing protein [Alphaproteobacteria bacterium]
MQRLGQFVLLPLLVGMMLVALWKDRHPEDGESKQGFWLRFKEWCLSNPWGVGSLALLAGLAIWTLLMLLLVPLLVRVSPLEPLSPKMYLAAYLQGLVLVCLAGPTIGIAIWRGGQAERQISQSQAQIDQTSEQIQLVNQQILIAQRQVRFQGFDSAVQMAVDVERPTRAVAGWKRLERWVDNEPPDTEDRDNYMEIARSAALSVLTLKSNTMAAFKDGLEQYEQAKDAPPSWQGVRHRYFEKTDDTRINEDVRQQAFEFLMKYPPLQWVESKRWELSDCDLSDLTLSREMLVRHDPKGEWEFVANGSHCISMRAWGMDFSNSKFVGASMMGAGLVGADLNDAHFSNADLRYADLSYAKLREALLYTPGSKGGPIRDHYEGGFVRFYKTQIDKTDFTAVKGLPADELKALLQGCWWTGGQGSPDASMSFVSRIVPVLPSGIGASYDIPGTPEKTMPTGGGAWEPSDML